MVNTPPNYHKKYYRRNRDKYKLYQHNYYILNRDRILQKFAKRQLVKIHNRKRKWRRRTKLYYRILNKPSNFKITKILTQRLKEASKQFEDYLWQSSSFGDVSRFLNS